MDKNSPIKSLLLFLSALFLFTGLACRLSEIQSAGGEDAQVLGDSSFYGYAYVDSNHNRQMDESDEPLKGARFSVLGFVAVTDEDGRATIVIPGGWQEPATAIMQPPQGSSYVLISPGEVELQANRKTHAEYLFAAAGESSEEFLLPTIPADLRGETIENQVYCQPEDGVELRMDIYYPRRISEPMPIILHVHGGGWVSGEKSTGAGRMFFGDLLRRGYVIASIDYRLAPEYTFPAQIEDVKCAVRYLRHYAQELHIDPERIGALGSSAGGHLVSLLGLADENAGWDEGAYAQQPSRVQAVVSLYGPADLLHMRIDTPHFTGEAIFGTGDDMDTLMRIYSPVTYASSDDPPFLIIQGEEDTVVPPNQATLLHEALQKAGVSSELIMVENAAHGLRPEGGAIHPRLMEIIRMVGDFFDLYLN